MTFEVSKAVPGDESVLADIMSQAAAYKLNTHNDIAWQDWNTGCTEYSEIDVSPYINAGNCYLCFVNGQAAGTISLSDSDPTIWVKEASNALYVHRLAVVNEYRGQGLGSKIIDWATQEALRKDKRYLRLDFHPSNIGLAKYYRSLGFMNVGERKVKEKYTVALYQKNL